MCVVNKYFQDDQIKEANKIRNMYERVISKLQWKR